MKMVMAAVLILVMAGLACSTSTPGADAKPSWPGKADEAGKPSVMAGDQATVMAESLNLRTLPDAAGPEVSKVIAVMAGGDLFTIARCEKVNGLTWAFGTFVDGHGRSWHGWALASWLSDGACHD